MAALLTSEAGNAKKLPANINEARRLQIDLLGPDVNKSDHGFNVDVVDGKKVIRYGLRAIKGIGDGIVDEIIAKRPYASFDDFLAKVDGRIVNKSAVLALIKAGAFDSFEPNRFKLWNYYCFQVRKFLPEGTPTTKKSAEFAPQYDENAWDKNARLEFEMESLGIYVTGHPLDDFPYTRWNDVPDGKRGVVTSGIVDRIKVHQAKNGEMAWVTIITKEDKRDVTIFANTWMKYGNKFWKGDIITVTGKKDGKNLIADKIEVVGKASKVIQMPTTSTAKKTTAKKSSSQKKSAVTSSVAGIDLDTEGIEILPDPNAEVAKRPDPLAELFTGALTS